MQQIIFGIFAHPDDEAFGPGGTLMKVVDEGAQLHLILVTDGQAGANPDNVADLGATRLNEWQAAAKLIGASSTHALHFEDSQLSHSLYPVIGSPIRHIVLRELMNVTGAAELSFVTIDPSGMTGHLDHIAVSYLTAQLFWTIEHELPTNIRLKELAYYCLSSRQANEKWPTYYSLIGRDDNYINRTVDVRTLLPRKYELIACHKSQRGDAAFWHAKGEDYLAEESFRVITPDDY